MPYKTGNGPKIRDVFYSKNVYVNGVPVALWMPPNSGGGADFGDLPEVSSVFSVVPISPLKVQAPENEAALDNLMKLYQSNTNKFVSKEDAIEIGIKENFCGTPPNITGEIPDGILPSTAIASDIPTFLKQILDEAQNKKSWREIGWKVLSNATSNINVNQLASLATSSVSDIESQIAKRLEEQIAISNPNIVNIWSNLGFSGNSPYWKIDQTPWCMGFVNFVLKACGYRYVQTANAGDIFTDPTKWGAEIISFDQGKAGDIVYWYTKNGTGHVNFIYSAGGAGGIGPPYQFVGGNQKPESTISDPVTGGDESGVTISPATSTTEKTGGIYRPVKT